MLALLATLLLPPLAAPRRYIPPPHVSVPCRASFASPPHVDTVSYAHFVLGGDAIELVLELDTDHLMQVTDAKPPLGEDWSDDDVRGVEAAASAYLRARWQLVLDGIPEAWTPRGFERLMAFDPLLQQERAIRLAFRFTLPAPHRDAQATLRQAIFQGLELGHRHFVLLEFQDRPDVELDVPPGEPFRFTLPDVGPGSGARRLRNRAVEGAGTGISAPWLLLFVAALLVAPLSARDRWCAVAAAIATSAAAFSLARADLIAPAPWAATAAAALSVAYVAAENRFARAVKMRIATAALFGLVHGMALAPRLRQGAVGATAVESAAFAAAALLVAVAAGAALALLATMARAFAARAAGIVIDGLLLIAGCAGIVLAIAQRGAS